LKKIKTYSTVGGILSSGILSGHPNRHSSFTRTNMLISDMSLYSKSPALVLSQRQNTERKKQNKETQSVALVKNKQTLRRPV